jgi:hypothetical protein
MAYSAWSIALKTWFMNKTHEPEGVTRVYYFPFYPHAPCSMPYAFRSMPKKVFPDVSEPGR